MPDDFTIAATFHGLTIDGETRRATAEFTVTNRLGDDVRARVRVAALEGCEVGWFTIQGEEERGFAVGEFHTYQVAIEVPDRAPAGQRCRFQLEVATVRNPDRERWQGQPVGFDVPESALPPPPPSRRPPPLRWAVAAAGTAVLVVLLVWPEKMRIEAEDYEYVPDSNESGVQLGCLNDEDELTCITLDKSARVCYPGVFLGPRDFRSVWVKIVAPLSITKISYYLDGDDSEGALITECTLQPTGVSLSELKNAWDNWGEYSCPLKKPISWEHDICLDISLAHRDLPETRSSRNPLTILEARAISSRFQGIKLGWIEFRPDVVLVKIEAEDFADASKVRRDCMQNEKPLCLGYIEPKAWVSYKGIDFGGDGFKSVYVNVASAKGTGGVIRIYCDGNPERGTLIAELKVPVTGDTDVWSNWRVIHGPLEKPIKKGKHDIYLEFTGNGKWVTNVDWIEFRD